MMLTASLLAVGGCAGVAVGWYFLRRTIATKPLEVAPSRPRRPRRDARTRSSLDRCVAVHEAGHTIAAWTNPFVCRISRVTLCTDLGNGQVSFEVSLTKSPMKDWYLLATALGGVAAEAIVYKRFRSAPAINDLKSALAIAKAIVADGDLLTPPWDGDEPTPGRFDVASMYKEVDEPVRRVLNLGYARAKGVVQRDRQRFDQVVQQLLEIDTMDEADVLAIFGPRPIHL